MGWLVGCGLDDRQGERGWADLFALPKVKIAKTINRIETNDLLTAVDDAGNLTRTLRIGGIELTHRNPPLKVAAIDGVQVQDKDHLRQLLEAIDEPLVGKF